jgi:hypothetical protein
MHATTTLAAAAVVLVLVNRLRTSCRKKAAQTRER